MNKKVLILGGAGYIGGYTTDYLTKNGYDVTVFDKLVYETRYLKKVNFVYGDIRDTDTVIDLAKNFDVVVIMAALVGDPACAVDVELTDSINRVAVKNICERIDDNIHVIFMSTCSVYGAQHDILDEESPTNPLSAYATTKLASEEYVENINGTIFRLGTVFGIGDTYSRIRLDLVANVVTMKSVYDKEIHIFGGEQWRPLICVKDISGYIEEAIRKDIRGKIILSQENVTMKILGDRICKMLPETKMITTDISFEDARNYHVSNEKSNKLFTYRPKHTLESEVKLLVELFNENRICNVRDEAYNNGQFIKKNLKKI